MGIVDHLYWLVVPIVFVVLGAIAWTRRSKSAVAAVARLQRELFMTWSVRTRQMLEAEFSHRLDERFRSLLAVAVVSAIVTFPVAPFLDQRATLGAFLSVFLVGTALVGNRHYLQRSETSALLAGGRARIHELLPPFFRILWLIGFTICAAICIALAVELISGRTDLDEEPFALVGVFVGPASVIASAITFIQLRRLPRTVDGIEYIYRSSEVREMTTSMIVFTAIGLTQGYSALGQLMDRSLIRQFGTIHLVGFLPLFALLIALLIAVVMDRPYRIPEGSLRALTATADA